MEFGVSQEGSRSQQNAIIGLKKQKQKNNSQPFEKNNSLYSQYNSQHPGKHTGSDVSNRLNQTNSQTGSLIICDQRN